MVDCEPVKGMYMPVGKMQFQKHLLEEMLPSKRRCVDDFLARGTLLQEKEIGECDSRGHEHVDILYILDHPDFVVGYADEDKYILGFGKVWDGWNTHIAITRLSIWTKHDNRIQLIRDYTTKPDRNPV